MAKVGRNAPCPCGSGKKYKKCCFLRQDGKTQSAGPQMRFIPVYTELDQLSNSVVDLIEQNKLDEAEAVSRRLLVDYPDHCLLYTSPSPRDRTRSRMPSSA